MVLLTLKKGDRGNCPYPSYRSKSSIIICTVLIPLFVSLLSTLSGTVVFTKKRSRDRSPKRMQVAK